VERHVYLLRCHRGSRRFSPSAAHLLRSLLGFTPLELYCSASRRKYFPPPDVGDFSLALTERPRLDAGGPDKGERSSDKFILNGRRSTAPRAAAQCHHDLCEHARVKG